MDAKAFLDTHGRAVAERVARRAGTNYAYFNQIAYGHRRPSVKLAQRLIEASAAEVRTKDERLDFEALLTSKSVA